MNALFFMSNATEKPTSKQFIKLDNGIVLKKGVRYTGFNSNRISRGNYFTFLNVMKDNTDSILFRIKGSGQFENITIMLVKKTDNIILYK